MTDTTERPQARLLGRPTPLELPAQREAPTASGLRESLTGRLLGLGAPPLLAVLDVLALAVVGAVNRLPAARLCLLVVLVLVLYSGAGLYRSRLSLSALNDLPVLGIRGLAAVLAAAVVPLFGTGDAERLPVLAASAVAALLAAHALGYALVRTARRRGLAVHRTLVIGAGQVGGQLADLLLEHREYGLAPVGFLDSDPLLPPAGLPVPLLGGSDRLADVIRRTRAHCVVVAFAARPESEMVEIIRTCDRLDCEIFFVPRLFELSHYGGDVDQVWGLPLVRMRRRAFRTGSRVIKRSIDLLLAGTAVALLSPLLLLIAALVRLEGGPGVLFRQVRIGVDGQPFTLLKFRSLVPVDADESATTWSIADDSRLRPVGRLLRRTSLDELPQLLNVVRGDMSLVGPRPERPHFVQEFARAYPHYNARHRVPSGLTGWAQVHGLRGDTSIEDRARFDNSYIQSWSPWRDVAIMLRTVGQVFRGAGG